MSRYRPIVTTAVYCCLSLMIMGCGGGDDGASDAKSTAQTAKDSAGPKSSSGKKIPDSNKLPAAAIGSENGEADDNEDRPEPPKKGTPEWLVLEITKIRITSFPKGDDVKKTAELRKQRNQEIIQLATEAISLTHSDTGKVELFNAAIHHLMEARYQLAYQGDQESIEALYEHAESLAERDKKLGKKSDAAAEAAYTLARYANANAVRFATQEPAWIQEFARQAKTFAQTYTQEKYRTRGVTLLYSAARSCELNRLTDEAVGCYALLEKVYPDSPQAKQAVAILRRLRLNGKRVQLAGPTIDGGYVGLEDFRGKVVLVMFWSSEAKKFSEDLPALLEISKKYQKYGVEILGVNLDEDESSVDAFLEKQAISWRQIFHVDPKKRRWNSPIVKYYGIRDIPMLWLIDRNGVGVDTMVDVSRLDQQLRALLTSERRTSGR